MEHVPLTETTEAVEGVHVALLAGSDQMNIQHFEIDPGAEVPKHNHENEQAGFVYTGEVVFYTDGEARRITAGDSYLIPANEPHAAENQGEIPVRGIDIFTPPRTDPQWQSD